MNQFPGRGVSGPPGRPVEPGRASNQPSGCCRSNPGFVLRDFFIQVVASPEHLGTSGQIKHPDFDTPSASNELALGKTGTPYVQAGLFPLPGHCMRYMPIPFSPRTSTPGLIGRYANPVGRGQCPSYLDLPTICKRSAFSAWKPSKMA